MTAVESYNTLLAFDEANPRYHEALDIYSDIVAADKRLDELNDALDDIMMMLEEHALGDSRGGCTLSPAELTNLDDRHTRFVAEIDYWRERMKTLAARLGGLASPAN